MADGPDGLQLGGLTGDEVADPQHLGAGDSSSSSRERDSSTQASQQVAATATSRPASTSPTAGANHA